MLSNNKYSETKCLVGYSGFIGGNLLLSNKFDYFFNSKNFHEAKYLNVDTIYFCGIPATKWYANENPDKDYNNIENIKNILNTVSVNKFILISTIDVYENINDNYDEDYECNYTNNHAYGKNRYLFEKYIKDTFKNHYIIRLPALFGYGLKKNIIYDLLKNNQINNIGINTSYQWYDLNWLNDDINNIINNNIKLCNFVTEPLDTKSIIKLFYYPNNIYNTTNNIKYNLKTKFSNIFSSNVNGYIRNKNVVLNNIIKFISYENIDKSKLCISNICVNEISQFQFSCILKVLGIKNVEIAPTKLIEWKNLDYLNLDIYKNNGITVYSYQSITYTLNHLNIFNEKINLLLEHLKNVINSASKNNVKVLVFGCPKNRLVNNSNIDNNELLIFIEFFRKLGEYCKPRNVIICIEPNSKKYNCNFINTLSEAENIVKKINHNNIKIMVDLGNIIMENDNIENIINLKDKIFHLHISEEFMNNFEYPNIINFSFKKYLNLINYKNIITLEMLIKDNELQCLINSILNFINIYGNKN